MVRLNRYRSLTPAERARNLSLVIHEEGTIQIPLFKPGSPGTGKRPKRPTETRRRRYEEAQRQAAIVQALRRLGYVVKETSEHRRPVRCTQCDKPFPPAGGNGVDRGIGDLLVSHADWGGVWLMLEVKSDAKATVRPEQAALRDGGYLRLVWTVEMAFDAVRLFEARLVTIGVVNGAQ